MAALKVLLILSALFALAYCAPNPGFLGGGKHEHHTIHVPYNVHTHTHTIHHHHVQKVPVIKEVVKEVPVTIIKEVHVPVYKEIAVPVHVHHDDHHGGGGGGGGYHKGWSSSGSGSGSGSGWY